MVDINWWPLLLLLVYITMTTDAQGDNWGPWEDWSPCSRSCGIGVSSQSRKCRGTSCIGLAQRYQTCNIQDCPEGSLDFRALQCSSFDKKLHRGKYYKWVPFTNSVTKECELTCMPKGHRFYVRLANAVHDGTRCRSDSMDICIQGKCQIVGCDLELDSGARFDKCGVCQGKNNTCKRIDGLFRLQKAAGYVEVIEIPAGSTSIAVEEIGKPKNYLALKNLEGKYFVNGNFKIEHSKQMRLNGHWATYTRSKAKQSLLITGPTDAPLIIEVLAFSSPPEISYEYYAPLSSVTTGSTKYQWKTSQWEECSAQCAGGKRYRKVSCVSSKTFASTVDALCGSSKRPANQELCNTAPCKPEWYTSDWSHCSKTCGQGKKIRRVHCIQRNFNAEVTMLPNLKCDGQTPERFKDCSTADCPAWKVTSWSQCSKSCGAGSQVRTVACVLNNTRMESNAADIDGCDVNNQPIKSRPCNMKQCDVDWVVGNWTECASRCGSGMKSRPVSCRDQSGAVHPEDSCDVGLKPSVSSDCFVEGPCAPVWHATEWSKCTGQCGNGLQHRRVFCAEGSETIIKVLDEFACAPPDRPAKMRACVEAKPCLAQYFAGPWGKCSAACGIGLRFRAVRCYADRRRDYSEKACVDLAKPSFAELCKLKPCHVPTIQPPTTPQGTHSIPSISKQPINQTELPSTTQNQPITVTTRSLITRTEIPHKRTTEERKSASQKHTTTLPPTRPNPALIPAVVIRLNGPARLSEGDSADYRCLTYGVPSALTSWRINGVSAKAMSPRVLIVDGGSHLVITSVRSSDEGSVACFATNTAGEDRKAIRTIVETAPIVSFSVSQWTGKTGERVSIDCKVTGRPAAIVTWVKDDYRFTSDSTGRVKVDGNSIVIRSTTIGDSGTYTCAAENSAGRSTAKFNLRVEDKSSPECFDNDAFADCYLIKSMGFCNHPFYKQHCCQSCSGDQGK